MGDLSVGDRVEVEVGPIAHGGHCVARHEGRVLFVRHALPGERVVAEVTEGAVGDRFLRADAVEVLLASPDRVSAPCRYAGRCGGCDFQHVSLSAQRRLKAEVVGEQFARLARRAVDVAVAPVPGDREGLRWRTRAEFALDQDGRIGMHPHRSHEVLPVEDCLIAVEALVPALTTDEAYAGRTGLDVVSPAAGGTVIVPLPVVAGEAVPVVHESVAGQRLTRDFEVSARGFWQVHPGAAATFVDAALELLVPQPGETVLDLYSGVGVFTAALAEAVGPTGRVLAVESDAEATVHAKANCAAYQGVAVVRARVDDFLGVARPKRRWPGGQRLRKLPARHPLAPPRADRILLDFYLTNVPAADLGAQGIRVRPTIDGHAMDDLPAWVPYYIENLPDGPHTISLQLIGRDGAPVAGPFNSTEQRITVNHAATAASHAHPDPTGTAPAPGPAPGQLPRTW